MRKITFIIFYLFIVALSSVAQSPVTWKASVKMSSKTEGEVVVTASVAEGWHLYGTDLPEGGPVETTFDFSYSDGISLKGGVVPSSEAVSAVDNVFGLRLSWWSGDVSFIQRFDLKGGEAYIKCAVRYMACDNNSCMTPQRVVLELPINENK